MGLVLRPLRMSDEDAFVAAYEATAREGFQFGHEFTPGMGWGDYLARMAELRAGVNIDGFVPTTFLVADVDGQTNLASRRVIEACGGRLAGGDGLTRRYWLESSP